ncbi:MAG: hypothetical protein LBT27_08990 [Prevotellaceae bacterium]|jgi:hypothetical protein|nr:hypothetical protein [Prevotellaceae bacterium]
MNTNILKLTVILFALAGSYACQKENVDDIHFKEISIGSENPSINYSSDGIEFNFCLLNAEGKPSTIFNEGENFSFYLKTTNNRDETLFFDYDFINNDHPAFCRVYDSEQKDYGKPFKVVSVGTRFVTNAIYLFDPDQDFTFQVSWVDNRNGWGWYNVGFENTQRDYLLKGSYYTEFEHNFVFRRTLDEDENSLKIKVKFKINFEIK